MPTIPLALSIAFIATTLITVLLFYKATANNKTILIVILAWLAIQSIPALKGFYANTEAAPPRFLLAVAPAVVAVLLVSLFSSAVFINTINLQRLTLLHIIRIPVELVLLYLFHYKAIPQIMTFEGRNWDILSGITAPIVYYFVFIKRILSSKWLLWWNVVGLLLLLNIVSIALLSAPFRFQQLGFEQPNVAVLYFPFIWLPCCVVPIVLFSHLVAIKKLTKQSL
ncbi:MAG: hypothetical protein C0459_08520 [Chitinophaga sp.]|jgi:hypothetical protein|nr:hypothetical protein [Chitinophaga sp.]